MSRTRIVLLATGPFCAAIIGWLINLLTNDWSWTLFSILVAAVTLTAVLTVVIDDPRDNSQSGGHTTPSQVNTLPRDIEDFTGREAEIERLLGMIEADRRRSSTLRVYSVDGMGGIGKTVLVTRIAYLLADRYPHGVLFVNLRAHANDQDPIDPFDALGILLSDLGVPGERVPETLEGRATLWRRELSGRKVLIVLDNAASPEQVRDLLPGTSSCLVLITSRRRMVELEALSSVSLEMLRPEDALRLFVQIIGSGRAAGKEEEIGRIIDRIGLLPLAIRLTASRLRAHPSWAVEDLLRNGIPRSRTLDQVYRLSFYDLDAEQRSFLRALALHPGDEITIEAAAVLSGASQERAAMLLDELFNRHLVEEPEYHRYRFHDLIRELVGQEGVPMEGQREAINRLLAYYAVMVDFSSSKIGNHDIVFHGDEAWDFPGPLPVDDESAFVWFDKELGNILACAHFACGQRIMPFSWQIPSSLTSFLRLRGFLGQAQLLLEAALRALEEHPDPLGEATIRRRIGHIARLRGDYPAARQNIETALRISLDLGERQSEAWCTHELAHLRRLVGESEEARDDLHRALEIHTGEGNELARAAVLTNLGMVYSQLDDREQAESCFREAFRITDENQDRRGLAFASYQWGALEISAAHYESAREHLDIALAIYDGVQNLHGQADCHYHLARLARLIGDYDTAREHLNRSLPIYLELGYRRGEADTYAEFGDVAEDTGDTVVAIMHRQRAAEIYRELNPGVN